MARNWSDPENDEPITYKNKYGEVVLYPLTEYMPVDQVESKNFPADLYDQVMINISDAERIALITENRRMSVSWKWPLTDSREEAKNFFVVKYSCVNRCCVCRVEIKEFHTPSGLTPASEIESLRATAF